MTAPDIRRQRPILAKSILLKALDVGLKAQAVGNWDSTMFRRFVHRHPVWAAFFVLIVPGVVIHIALAFVPKDACALWLHLYSVGHALADLLIAAGLVGVLVDYFLKRTLIRDVWTFIIGHALPPEVQDRIRGLSQTSVVRK